MSDQANIEQQIQVAEQLQSQLGSLEQQYQEVQEYLQDLRSARKAVERLAEQETGEEVLLPMGSGTYVHATLTRTDAVISSLGGGILAEERPQKAAKRIEAREQEAAQAQEQLEENMEQLQAQLTQLVTTIRQGGAGAAPPEGA